MGRVNPNPVQAPGPGEAQISSEQPNQHFSHPHALQLTNQPNTNNSCFACEVTLSGPTYSCLQCNYFLHLSCFQKPRKIKHPFDINGHTLHLLPVPPYPEGTFCCDACGKKGTGFCYNCAQCGIDLHATCASMPLLANHGSHPHQLSLTFSPPHHDQTFSCDLCTMTGSNHWLYRCQPCGFDAHLDCAMGNVISAPVKSRSRGIVNNQQNYSNRSVQFQQPSAQPQGNFNVQYHQQPIRQGNCGPQYQQQPKPQGNYGPQYQQQPMPQGNYGPQYQQQPMPQGNYGPQYQQQLMPQGNYGPQYQQQPMPQGNYGPVRPNGGMMNNSVSGLIGGASQALMMGVLGIGGLGLGGRGLGGLGLQALGLGGGGGGDLGGGSGGGYYDGGYAEMTDLQTMDMADSADTMDSI